MNIFLISIFFKIAFVIYIFLMYKILFSFKKHISVKKKLLVLLFFHLVGLAVIVTTTHFSIREDIKKIKTRNFYVVNNITVIKNESGQIIGRIGHENREYENLEHIPPIILRTLINVEDESFFSNYGISLKNMTFNFVKALFTTQKITGASTITQQLARNLFLSNKISILRKIKEIYISIYLSYYLNKEQILEMYVNHIFLGENIYGLKSATKYYFDKDIKHLKLEEIAFLIGIVKGPSYYIKNNDAAIERKNYVLKRMLNTELITQVQYDNIKNNPIVLKHNSQNISGNNTKLYGYVIEDIKEQLKKLNLDPKDGLVIHITLEEDLQQITLQSLKTTLDQCEAIITWRGPLSKKDESLQHFKMFEGPNIKVVHLYKNGTIVGENFNGVLHESHLKKYENLIINKSIVLVEKKNDGWYLKNPPQLNGAVIIIDPDTGKIKASIGGRGFQFSFFNGITQVAKSPGSILKIIPCITALEKGYSPEYIIQDVPIYVDKEGKIVFISEEEVSKHLENEDIKVVKNLDHKYLGPLSLKDALVKSRNVPIILLTSLLGINNVKKTAVNMGIISDNVPYYLSSSLGSLYMPVQDIAKALCCIPNGGYKIDQLYFITKITDLKGKILYTQIPEEEIINNRKKILSDATVITVNNICTEVVHNGILKNKLSNITMQIAGKTGTAQGNKEAAFVVWHGKYLIYVLVYNIDNETPGYLLWGSDAPLRVAKNILAHIEKQLSTAKIENPL